MVKQNKLLIIGSLGIAALAAYNAVKKINAVENLTWVVDSVAVDKKNTNILSLGLITKIRITNPTETAVSFDGFNANVSLKGSLLVTLNKKAAITIAPGNTTIVIPSSVSIPALALQLVDVVKAFITGSGFKEVLNVTGTMYAGNLSIPLKQEIALSFGQSVGALKIKKSPLFPKRKAKLLPADLSTRQRFSKIFPHKNVSGIGKARVSLEFDTNEAAADYFQRSNLYVTSTNTKGFSKN